MRMRRLTGVAIGLVLSSTVVGAGAAQTPCDILLDYLLKGDERARTIYELRCGDPRLGFRFRPRVPNPSPAGRSDRVIDLTETRLVEVTDDVRHQYTELADDIRELHLDHPSED